MDDEEIIGTTLPHSDFGDPDCCGCLNGVIRGEQADIICHECNLVVRKHMIELQIMTPERNVCGCQEWLPNYDGSLMCYHCKFPFSKERADIVALFWRDHRPSDFFEAAMCNVSKLKACFDGWLAVEKAGHSILPS